MCIFCVGDNSPFYLRKSAAFPRKLIAEVVETEDARCEKARSAQLAPGLEVAPAKSHSSKRTSGSGGDGEDIA